jgi:hypothetical protein
LQDHRLPYEQLQKEDPLYEDDEQQESSCCVNISIKKISSTGRRSPCRKRFICCKTLTEEDQLYPEN